MKDNDLLKLLNLLHSFAFVYREDLRNSLQLENVFDVCNLVASRMYKPLENEKK